MSGSGVALVMPIAGRGSRFAKHGFTEPKPLIALHGRPFFWWAAESVRHSVLVEEMVFVVLAEHCRDHAIDRKIAGYYPHARIVVIPEVTSGAAETARIGVEALDHPGPLAVNDCDHAFVCRDLAGAAGRLRSETDGTLLCFRSENPAYSYASLRPDGTVAGTVEKQVISPFAIAGCYMFANRDGFLSLYDEYRADCPYDELFISGMFNSLAAKTGRIAAVEATWHVPFGTPEEYGRIDFALLRRKLNWSETECPPIL